MLNSHCIELTCTIMLPLQTLWPGALLTPPTDPIQRYIFPLPAPTQLLHHTVDSNLHIDIDVNNITHLHHVVPRRYNGETFRDRTLVWRDAVF